MNIWDRADERSQPFRPVSIDKITLRLPTRLFNTGVFRNTKNNVVTLFSRGGNTFVHFHAEYFAAVQDVPLSRQLTLGLMQMAYTGHFVLWFTYALINGLWAFCFDENLFVAFISRWVSISEIEIAYDFHEKPYTAYSVTHFHKYANTVYSNDNREKMRSTNGRVVLKERQRSLVAMYDRGLKIGLDETHRYRIEIRMTGKYVRNYSLKDFVVKESEFIIQTTPKVKKAFRKVAPPGSVTYASNVQDAVNLPFTEIADFGQASRTVEGAVY